MAPAVTFEPHSATPAADKPNLPWARLIPENRRGGMLDSVATAHPMPSVTVARDSMGESLPAAVHAIGRVCQTPTRCAGFPRRTAKLRTALLFILRGESAPSLSSVARQLGLSVSNLAEKCPDLCRPIRSRYLRCQKERTREREQLLNEEVCRIAKHLHAKGQIPTEARIMRSLSKGALKQWGAVRRAVKSARRILGLR